MILAADKIAPMHLPQARPAFDPSDDLLGRARAGEDAALEALIAQQEPRVYALARAVLKNRDWAEDATQETFLRIVQHLPEFHDSANAFGAWVLTIARNVALDIWRKRRTRNESSAEDFDAADAPLSKEALRESPLDELVAREDVRSIVAAVSELPGPWREVLVLRYYHHLEPVQISKVLDVTPENARIRLWRALQELRRKLGEQGNGPEMTTEPRP